MKVLKFLLYALILSFCLGQFGKLPGPPGADGGEVNVYLWDALAALLVLFWLFQKLGIEKRLKLGPFWGRTLLFAFVALISLVNGKRWIGVGEWAVAAGYWIRWVVYAGVYFVVSDITKKIPNTKYQILNTLIFSGVILSLLGLIQLAIFPNLSELDPRLGWDPHQGRMVSTWLDPNFLGAYFVLCLSLLTGRLFRVLESEGGPHELSEVRRGPLSLILNTKYLILYSYYLLLVTSLILTFSRSAWGMLAVVLGFFGSFKSRKLLLLMFALFFAAYFLVPRVQTRLAGITDPADSASLRLVSWQRTFEIIKKHPLIGVGFNAFRYGQEREGFFRDERGVPSESGHAGAGSDSSLLLVWATTGIFGLLAYLWLYGSIAWRALKKYRAGGLEYSRHSELGSESRTVRKEILKRVQDDCGYDKFLSLSLLAALAGLFAESNFINSLFYPPILLWLWIVTALVVEST